MCFISIARVRIRGRQRACQFKELVNNQVHQGARKGHPRESVVTYIAKVYCALKLQYKLFELLMNPKFWLASNFPFLSRDPTPSNLCMNLSLLYYHKYNILNMFWNDRPVPASRRLVGGS
jgi:hypothetical protein